MWFFNYECEETILKISTKSVEEFLQSKFVMKVLEKKKFYGAN